MNVVIRGLMAAAMAVYAVMHAVQAVSPPDSAPAWLVVMFALTALVALVVAGGLIMTARRDEVYWEEAAAALAGASLLALILSYTAGFFGVSEGALRAETALVFVAEVVTLVAWAVSRVATRETSEVSEAVPNS